jgi:hypothetical protein
MNLKNGIVTVVGIIEFFMDTFTAFKKADKIFVPLFDMIIMYCLFTVWSNYEDTQQRAEQTTDKRDDHEE